MGERRADLLARRGNQFTVFEIKVPGRGDPSDWARHVVALRDEARAAGGRFELVMVRPPRQTSVAIDGLEALLRDALIDEPPPELEELSYRTTVDDVSGVEILALDVRGDSLDIEGEATVTVTLRSSEGDSVATENFPFSFHAKIDHANQIQELDNLSVDVSSWTGDPD